MLAMARGGIPSFYHRDAHASKRLLTNGAGAATDSYLYDAYGGTVSATGSTINPYLHSGERFDASSALYQLRARYSDAAELAAGRRAELMAMRPWLAPSHAARSSNAQP
jgi:hypothetical protein